MLSADFSALSPCRMPIGTDTEVMRLKVWSLAANLAVKRHNGRRQLTVATSRAAWPAVFLCDLPLTCKCYQVSVFSRDLPPSFCVADCHLTVEREPALAEVGFDETYQKALVVKRPEDVSGEGLALVCCICNHLIHEVGLTSTRFLR